MDSNKEIKVYGTLVNWTVNDSIKDNEHNDAVAYAKLLYDDRFGATPNAANFQDVINRRVTAISYADGVTTIKNRAGVPDGNPYMFVVDGASNLKGNAVITGNATITGNERVDGNESVGGTMTVTGATTLNNTLHTTGKVTADSGIDIAGGDLDVQNGNAHIKKNLTVDGTANIAGATTLQNTLNVAGNTTVTNLHATGNTEVDGNEHIHGMLTVDGETTLDNNLHVTGDTNIDGDTTIVGNTSIGEDLSVHDNISCDTLSVENNAHVGGILDVFHLMPMNGLTVTGTAMFNDNVEIDGKLDVPNGEISGKTLHITTTGAIDSNLTVGGTINATGNVTSPNIVDITNKIEALIAGMDDTTLDTIKEIADYIKNHVGEAAAIFANLEADITALQSDLAAETRTRAANDTAEATARANAVTAEANARVAADTALGGRIDSEATSRDNADTALGARIDAEVQARAAADTLETQTRTTAISGLDTRITNLENAGYVTETSLNTTLAGYATSGSLSNYVTNSALTTTLASYATTSDLNALVARVTALEGLWSLVDGKVTSSRAAVAAGFYDSTVS